MITTAAATNEVVAAVVFILLGCVKSVLEKYMMQLVQIMSKVTELTNEYKERVNSKKIEDKSNFSTQYH